MNPENVEQCLFLKYNVRALDYKIGNLQSVPDGFVPPNSNALPIPELDLGLEDNDAEEESDSDIADPEESDSD